MKALTTSSLIVLAAVAGAALAVERSLPGGGEFALVEIPESAVHHGTTHDPRVRESVANGTSTNWSGYAVETSLASPQNGVVTDVKGSWTVPSVTATDSSVTYSSIWVGIDGDTSKTVEQCGTEQDVVKGTVVNYAWFEMYPKRAYRILNFPVSPNDVIHAEVSRSGRLYTLTLENATQHASFTITLKMNSADDSSAEWIVEAPSGGHVLPLANFGTASMYDCTATLNGHTGPIDDSAWENEQITMQSGTTVKAVPSGLTTAAGKSAFTVDWKHE
jgi:hypothetical protein